MRQLSEVEAELDNAKRKLASQTQELITQNDHLQKLSSERQALAAVREDLVHDVSPSTAHKHTRTHPIWK